MKKAAQKIWLARPEMMGNEMEYVRDSFESGWITTAFKEDSYIGRFEQSVAEFLRYGHPVAVQSGTAALHLALRLCGVGKGDVVFCSDLTFTATANPIRYLGAEPIFIDSEPVSNNMDPDSLEMAFESGVMPKAVVVVHVYGMPADMERIMEICNRFGVPVIEDSAESLGSAVYGKKTGTFGRFGCMSFNGNKMITAGGTGGMLICQNKEDAERASFLALFRGMSIKKLDITIGWQIQTQHLALGRWNILKNEYRRKWISIGDTRKNSINMQNGSNCTELFGMEE